MGNLDVPMMNGKYLIPNNFCIGEVECALGSKLLKRVDKMNLLKRKRAFYFIDKLKSYQNLNFHREKTNRHNYHLLAAYDSGGKRDKFISEMASIEKIQCIVQYLPLNRYPLYKKLGFGKSVCPNADYFFDNMISFPFQSTLTDNQFEILLDSTIKVLKRIY